MIGRYIFTFMAGGSVFTFGLLAGALIVTGGKIAMGIYDAMAIPIVFLFGGIVMVGVAAWLRKQQKK